MSTSQYYIVGDNNVWMIQFKDTENGRYKSSNEAASFAIATAQELGMRGDRARVCLLDGDGRLRCKWSYREMSPAPEYLDSTTQPVGPFALLK